MTKEEINEKVRATLSKLIDELNEMEAPVNFIVECVMANNVELFIRNIVHQSESPQELKELLNDLIAGMTELSALIIHHSVSKYKDKEFIKEFNEIMKDF